MYEPKKAAAPKKPEFRDEDVKPVEKPKKESAPDKAKREKVEAKAAKEKLGKDAVALAKPKADNTDSLSNKVAGVPEGLAKSTIDA